MVIAIFSAVLLLTGCYGTMKQEEQVVITIKKMPSIIRLGENIDPKDYVTVTDQKGKALSLNHLIVKGEMNTNQTGTYKLTFSYKSEKHVVPVSKVVKVIYERTERTAFKTKYVDDDSMMRGENRVHQNGKNGIERVRYDAKRVNGKIILGATLKRETVKPSQTKIVYSGTQIPENYKMNVVSIRQLPELPTGCEITAVTMMLRFHGAHVNKIQMANEMPRAVNGDPDTGFVGSPFTKSGVTINPPALMGLVKKYAGSAVNLTGASTEQLKDYLSRNHPVVIWGTFDGFSIHALTLTGYNQSGFYYNDPWSGAKRWMTDEFLVKHWSDLNRQAITF